MIVTLEEAKQFMKIDYDEDNTIIEMIINSAEQFIDDSTDSDIDKTQAKVKTIALMLIDDMYDNREFTGNGRIKQIVKMMLLQL